MPAGMWNDIGMGLTGVGEGSDIQLWGTKPITPDLGASAKEAIKANQANLADLEALGGNIDKYNYDQLGAMLRKALPGYDDIIARQSSILQSQLKGEIPQDVQDAIQRNSAVKSIYGGFGGSGMGRNLEARDLGLTSLEITNHAIDSASRWMDNVKSLTMPKSFDITSMFITPEQQYQRNLLAASIDAAPDPVARGNMEKAMMVNSNIGASVGGAFGGGGGGTVDTSKLSGGGGYPSGYSGGYQGNMYSRNGPMGSAWDSSGYDNPYDNNGGNISYDGYN